MFSIPIPLSLYIHMPWCVRKCPYCDFNSHALSGEIAEETYIQALIRDLENDLPRVCGRRLVSIFIGGGTPSLFSPSAIEKLLSEVRARIAFSPTIEITLEANPGTVEQEKFAGYLQAGINRLSIGVQSFQDDKLNALGRIHGADEARKAIASVHAAGFENFNIDLMHGLPKQTLADAIYDLNIAISLNPTHISWYQLTLEPNTVFYKQPPKLPTDDFIDEMQVAGKRLLADNGFMQYEISAYAKQNCQCQHNLNYWEFGDYLGIGAGAHSKITDVATQTITRLAKVRQPKNYLDRETFFIAKEEVIAEKERIFEFMLNALRLGNRISVKLFNERTGLSFESLKPYLAVACDKKLLHWDEDGFEATALGKRFYNDLVSLFLS